MVYEAYKRYEQLQTMIQQSKNNLEYLKAINSGMDSIQGLILNLPIADQKILGEFHSFEEAMKAISELYGIVPKSQEAHMETVHDQTIAESIKVTNGLKDYADVQEANAVRAFQMSGAMSPKGAARLSASTNAQILHTLAQLLRVNGQLLKLQSESLGVENKHEKDSVGSYNKVNADVKTTFAQFSGDLALPRF